MTSRVYTIKDAEKVQQVLKAFTTKVIGSLGEGKTSNHDIDIQLTLPHTKYLAFRSVMKRAGYECVVESWMIMETNLETWKSPEGHIIDIWLEEV